MDKFLFWTVLFILIYCGAGVAIIGYYHLMLKDRVDKFEKMLNKVIKYLKNKKDTI